MKPSIVRVAGALVVLAVVSMLLCLFFVVIVGNPRSAAGAARSPAPDPRSLTPTQCPGGVCPSPGGAIQVDPYRVSPYRHYQDQRDRQQNDRLGQLERSHGTMPLPVPPAQTAPVEPSISNEGLLQRVVRLELEADTARRERADLTRRADAVRDTAKELAEKYDPQLQGISADVNEAIAISTDATKAAGVAASVAGDAKTQADSAAGQAAGAVTKADDVAGKVAAVEQEVGGLRGKVAEILQGGGPVKQFIQGKLEERGLSPTVAALAAGLGVGLIAVVVIVFLRKEGVKAAAGDPTVAQRLAALTPSELDDRVAAAVAKGQAALHERIAELRGHVAGLASRGGQAANPTES